MARQARDPTHPAAGAAFLPDYDIYVLDESAISISGGEQLDGVTQGDGSHLDGLTITLNSAAWQPVAITDDDADFQDNDSGQTLNGPATIDGTTYSSGTSVEAEFGIVVSDGTNSWTLVGFNVSTGSPSYATIEGLAFIGGPGGFPPVGVPLTVTSTFEGPAFASSEYATPICLVAGTLVDTASGRVPIETVRPGDLVLTRDNGMQIVNWAGQRRVNALGSFAPVCVAEGTLGNDRALRVSQQHRILLEGWRAELICGQDSVLVPALHLLNDSTIRLAPGGSVTYVHLLFDGHEVIHTNGCWTESLYPGDNALASLLPAARAELLALFPSLAEGWAAYGPLSHPLMSRREAALAARSFADVPLGNALGTI